MTENVDLHPKIKHQASFGMSPAEAGQLNSMAWWALSICSSHSSWEQRGGLLLTWPFICSQALSGVYFMCAYFNKHEM